MFKYFLSMTALMVSVAGIGISLAREEFRCYLGLTSPECNSLVIQSTSPTPIEAKFEQKYTEDNLDSSPSLKTKYSDSLEKNYVEEKEEILTIKEKNEIDTQFVSIEELSRTPENKNEKIIDNSLPSGEEGYIGIPIEVQPYNRSEN